MSHSAKGRRDILDLRSVGHDAVEYLRVLNAHRFGSSRKAKSEKAVLAAASEFSGAGASFHATRLARLSFPVWIEPIAGTRTRDASWDSILRVDRLSLWHTLYIYCDWALDDLLAVLYDYRRQRKRDI